MKGMKYGVHAFCATINTFGMAVGIVTSSAILFVWCAFWLLYSLNEICHLTKEK